MTTQPPLHLLVPRPKPQANAFAAQIERAMPGRWAIDIAPLFTIEATGADVDVAGVDALIFSSRNGVSTFVQINDNRQCPAFCVGARTTEFAQKLGLTAEQAGTNVASLVQAMEGRPKMRFLHLHGVHTTGNLAARLEALGHQVRQVQIYDQPACPLPPETVTALTTGQIHAATLFSPRTAELLLEQAGPMGLPPAMALICLSQAVAAVVEGKHSGPVIVCETPDEASMLSALQAFSGI